MSKGGERERPAPSSSPPQIGYLCVRRVTHVLHRCHRQTLLFGLPLGILRCPNGVLATVDGMSGAPRGDAPDGGACRSDLAIDGEGGSKRARRRGGSLALEEPTSTTVLLGNPLHMT